VKPSRHRQLGSIPTGGGSNFLESRNKLLEAERLRQTGRLEAAQSACSRLIAQHPDFAAALHSLGLILSERGLHLDALPFLVRAAMHNPENWSIHTALGVAYLRLGATEAAKQSLDRAQSLSPDQASIHASIGELHREQREYELAVHAFKRACDLDSGLGTAHAGLGLALVYLGRLPEAAKAFEASLARMTSNLNTLFQLAGLPRPLVTTDLLSIISKLPAPKTRREEAKIAFLRGEALNQRGNYGEAWKAFTAANAIMFSELEPAWQRQRLHDQQFVGQLKSSAVVPATDRDDQPISLFILGPSRSGKTTVEFLVSSLSGVKRGFENLIVEKSVTRSFHEAALPPRDRLKDLPKSMDPQFRNHYRALLLAAADGNSVFTNTHPGNMLDAMRLAALLPSSRFILVKRNVDDLTLRIFMKMFLDGHPYAYSLDSIRTYVQTYYSVLDVLAERLPGRTLTITYDEMIADPKRTRDAIAGLCMLTPAATPVPDLGDDRGCAKHYPLGN
jgi:tetratricopeptide (TPR) repeat protein